MPLVPWSPLLSGLSRWPSVWDDEDLASLTQPAGNNLEVYETANEIVVKANVAGVPVDKVDITFEKGVLWIKAEKAEAQQDEQKKHYSRSSWSYSYKIAVPGMYDPTKEPSAEVTDGVLVVTFAKSEASKPKKLTIKAVAKES